MAKKKLKTDVDSLNVEDYRHSGAKRKNNPPAKIAAEGTVPALPKIEYAYSPRRPPVLRFDTSGKADQLPELLEKATNGPLTKDEAQILAEALRTQQPWLEWAGKQEAESKGFSVDPVALHIHERISAQAILKVAARKDVERTLFSDPEQEYHEAVQFYKHDIDWTNRLILGDSLQVMSSLAHREDLAGKVQMVFMDPPYGIKFRSNFQPVVSDRSVTEKAEDLTREPEMVKAYRDTWRLGLHSYLSYLRDRLVVVRELLAPKGSVFVQIGDDNAHKVRSVLDEVFGEQNFVSQIAFTKGGAGLETEYRLAARLDYILWYARDVEQMRFNKIREPNATANKDATTAGWIESSSGFCRRLTTKEKQERIVLEDGDRLFVDESLTKPGPGAKYDVPFQGRTFDSGRRWWGTQKQSLERALRAERVFVLGNTLRRKKYLDESTPKSLNNLWDGLGGPSDPIYVVQTNSEIVKRCLLMSTTPGDLVLDPTCGSGTTASVAEEWGRRWITIDTSRVAVTLAKHRILTAVFPFYLLKDSSKGISGGLEYEKAVNVTLASVATNTALDPILHRHDGILETALATVNAALPSVTNDVRSQLLRKLMLKEKAHGSRAVTEADRRRWELPKKSDSFEHWTVPFDTDTDWPRELRQAVTQYRQLWQNKIAEVNDCISANAQQVDLVDQPKIERGITRVSGPFTVEAVQPPERSLGAMEGMFDGAPEELDDTFDMKNVESYLDQMTRLLKLDGVRFPNNKEMAFSRLDRLTGQAGGLHAEGRWLPKGETDDDPEGKAIVAVGFGPQYGPVTAKQVEDLIRSASRRGYDALVVAGFSFDGPAQATIEDAQHPKLRIHMASIRPDVNPGMAGLLKEQPGNQLFTVFGQPRIRLEGPNRQNEYVIVMEGVDVYNPVDNSIRSTGADKVAAWFIDGDYDGRTFCVTQAFFPDKSAWDKLTNALGGVVSEEAFEKLSGTVSLPFPAGKHMCVAAKVIDPRGNEVMQVIRLK